MSAILAEFTQLRCLACTMSNVQHPDPLAVNGEEQAIAAVDQLSYLNWEGIVFLSKRATAREAG